ncbi:unnamed protein product [Medioppia subpectinata]|uniref:Ig-like domain-containing protein n=1 Tax=Medioppia subpectinata TaxID=1979941 RepID=A0A7R9L1D1_9ACAR|nr:unnamed protein product [Medioppia subpectinata]CAG2113781.1 unnamed protein product [Medioppia subpectinata]
MWRINSVEEITTTTTASISEEEEDDDSTSIASYPSLQLNLNPLKVPFPEAGVDLIDTTVDDYQLNHHLIQENGVKCYDCQTWQQNWLFKKAKKMDNKSDIMLGYMAMIIAELPICMLIPNPIEKVFRPVIGDRDVDELSDLSEHNSVGSLDFSDDESDYEETIDTNDVMEMTSDVSKVEECQKVVPIIMTTISKTTNTIEKECNESKAIINMKVSVVSNKVKPIVKTVTKVPNYLPKELRVNDRDSGSDPYLVLRPGDACVQSAITVQFICRARGSKPLLYSWFKGDSLLQSDQHFRIFQSGEENILEIMNTSQEYSDQYSCVVYNRFGYQWCDFTLQVRNTSFVSNKCHKMPLKMTTTTVDNECEPKSEAVSEVSNITINPKHDKHKTRPFVIQRTWAERVAELNSKAQNKQNESNVEFKGDNKDCEEETRVSVPTLMTCTIAEREHKKWENPDIDWKDSPYSAENLNSRLQQRVLSLNSLNESSIERTDNTNDENEAESAFLSSNSKDMSRYRKDYYVKQQPMSRDETLRSFDENV